MKKNEVKPTGQTYICLLNACAASGRTDRVYVIISFYNSYFFHNYVYSYICWLGNVSMATFVSWVMAFMHYMLMVI